MNYKKVVYISIPCENGVIFSVVHDVSERVVGKERMPACLTSKRSIQTHCSMKLRHLRILIRTRALQLWHLTPPVCRVAHEILKYINLSSEQLHCFEADNSLIYSIVVWKFCDILLSCLETRVRSSVDTANHFQGKGKGEDQFDVVQNSDWVIYVK